MSIHGEEVQASPNNKLKEGSKLEDETSTLEDEKSKLEDHATSDDGKPEEAAEIGSKKKISPFLAMEKEEAPVEEEKTEAKKLAETGDPLKDSSIFTSTGKLYFLSKKTNKLETRGSGIFYIFKDKSEMYRLMMIRDHFKLKGCNHYVMPACPLTKATQLNNSWVWTALDDKSDAEKNEERTVYFATFADAETSELFEKKYNEAKDENGKKLEGMKNTADTEEVKVEVKSESDVKAEQ